MGPFVPSWVPPQWHWTKAFTDRITTHVKAVGASLTCLPAVDEGGPGPRLESWAFAVDNIGMGVLVREGVFEVRSCKLCPDGVVVQGEYKLSKVLFAHGFNIATLLSMYSPDIDWREQRHHSCNNNVHPSRYGTYDSITMHPFETIFVKSSWHVGEPYTSKYSKWYTEIAHGSPNTNGNFDESMYTYAIGPEAILPHDSVSECFNVAISLHY